MSTTKYGYVTKVDRSMRGFIRRNRAEIDAAIRKACPNIGSLNDNDREQWIGSDCGLYAWARSSGVRV